MPKDALVPDCETIRGWIETVFAQGVRRPGYPADRWAEQFCADRFRQLGFDDVRLEPVTVPYWEPRSAALRVRSRDEEHEIDCFPLPFSSPTQGLEAELVAFDRDASPTSPDLRGKASLYEVPLMRLPADLLAGAAEGDSLDSRVVDPGGSLADTIQVLPFGPEIQAVMEPSIAAGAACFIGALSGYPGDSFEYYVPYDGVERPIPGVWIRGSDGQLLRERLGAGPVQVNLQIDAVLGETTSHNVVGELSGADDECVVIGSHHDGPWSSAVEDGSGIALVLAQATYWSRVPREERPHRLVFLLNAGHMAGGAGCRRFLEQHAATLDQIVLELHLEHAAREFAENDGVLTATAQPETRWWFTSRIPTLERSVVRALEAESLGRSLILPPDVLGPHPTTDGGFFHSRGVPLVNFLAAPFYLFDAMDRMDKIDTESLVPITRAAIRIVDSTRGVSAAALRAQAG